MRKNYAAERRKALKFRKLLYGAIIAALVYFSVLYFRQWKIKNSLTAEMEEYRTRIEETDREITALQKDYEKRDTLEFVEKTAREKLGMVKAKELIVIDREDVRNKEQPNSRE